MVSASKSFGPGAVRSTRGVAKSVGFRLWPYVFAILGVAVATALLFLTRPWLQWGEIALLYLPVVIVLSIRFGFGPAVVGALLSFSCCDYFFLQPYYKHTGKFQTLRSMYRHQLHCICIRVIILVCVCK